MKFLKKITIILGVTTACVSQCLASATGGLVWTIPSDHFKNVDKMGNVRINELWHRMDLGNGWNLPIYGLFSSVNKDTSNLLRKHWRMPLFESTAIQKDEKNYIVKMPDGRILNFRQIKNHKNNFRASDVWKGEVRNGTFIVTSIYNVELTYKNGRLQRIKAPERYGDYDLSFKYKKGVFIELKNKSKTILEAKHDGENIVYEFKIDKTEILISHSETTTEEVSEIIVAKNNEALKRYILNEHGSLEIISDSFNNIIIWDPQTGAVKKDGEYAYTITPSSYQGGYAKIARIGPNGVKEFWYRDNWNGKEIILRKDGVLIEKEWFTTGKLRNLTKSLTTSRDGKYKVTNEFFYDENQRLVRTLEGNKENFLIYDQTGRLAVQVTDGKIAREFIPGMAYLAKEYLKN